MSGLCSAIFIFMTRQTPILKCPKSQCSCWELWLTLHLYAWQYVQVGGNGCVRCFHTWHWVNPRVLAEECWQTRGTLTNNKQEERWQTTKRNADKQQTKGTLTNNKQEERWQITNKRNTDNKQEEHWQTTNKRNTDKQQTRGTLTNNKQEECWQTTNKRNTDKQQTRGTLTNKQEVKLIRNVHFWELCFHFLPRLACKKD